VIGIVALVIHGLVDGFVIPLGFSISASAGFVIALGVALHQIPDSFAAVSISIASTGDIRKRFTYIATSALDTPLGILIGVFFAELGRFIIPFGLGVSAGTFIYVSAVDLIPELKDEARGTLVLLSIIAGFSLIFVLSLFSI
jgi:zinc transporter ZupT